MMSSTKVSLDSTTNIGDELQWLEKRLEEIKEYVDNNPYHLIRDRMSPDGKKIVATIESQQKSIRDALKDYAALLSEVDKLRESEKRKLEVRGGAKLSSRMEKLMSGE